MIFRFWAILGAIETQLEKASENTVTATSEVSEGVKTLSVSEGGRKIERKKETLFCSYLKLQGSTWSRLAWTLPLVSSFEGRGWMYYTLIAPHWMRNHCGWLSMTSCVRKVMEPRPTTPIASSSRSATPSPAGCKQSAGIFGIRWSRWESTSLPLGLLTQFCSSVLHCLITAAAAIRAAWYLTEQPVLLSDRRWGYSWQWTSAYGLSRMGSRRGGFTPAAAAVSDGSSGCAAPPPVVFGYIFKISGLSGVPLHDRNANKHKQCFYPLADRWRPCDSPPAETAQSLGQISYRRWRWNVFDICQIWLLDEAQRWRVVCVSFHNSNQDIQDVLNQTSCFI